MHHGPTFFLKTVINNKKRLLSHLIKTFLQYQVNLKKFKIFYEISPIMGKTKNRRTLNSGFLNIFNIFYH